MKIWAWSAAVGSVMAMVACGSSGSSSSTTGTTGSGGDTTTGTGGTMTTSSGTTSTSSTTGSTTGSGGTMGCGSFQFSETEECQLCAEQSCCAELALCDTGSPCGALFDCLAGCSDETCQTDCIQNQAPDGVPDAQALIECMTGPQGGTGACNMECSTGVICDTGLQIMSNPACGDCLGQQCCDEYNACVADMGSPTCLDCITGATEAGCDMNAALATANACRTTKCAESCGGTICDTGLSTSNLKCDTCLGDKCCDVISACQDDATCFNDCLTTNMPAAACANDAKYQAVKTCWNTNCSGMNDCGNML